MVGEQCGFTPLSMFVFVCSDKYIGAKLYTLPHWVVEQFQKYVHI